jgi:apolipoprotein N-acyltransferase
MRIDTMGLITFCLGAMIVFILWGMTGWIKRNQIKLSWLSWLGVILTSFLAFFSVVWFLSCIIERETQAAGLGLLIFGALAFIAFGITRKKIIRDTKSQAKGK